MTASDELCSNKAEKLSVGSGYSGNAKGVADGCLQYQGYVFVSMISLRYMINSQYDFIILILGEYILIINQVETSLVDNLFRIDGSFLPIFLIQVIAG